MGLSFTYNVSHFKSTDDVAHLLKAGMPTSVSPAPLERWHRLEQLLTGSDSTDGVKIGASEKHLSLIAAIENEQLAADTDQAKVGRDIAQKLKGLLHQLALFEKVSHCPVVAITGMLNAGKSSLLATYLSPAGRKRVLRGLGNAQGTHRFVIWLPQVWWTNTEMLNTLISFLTNVFGHAPEQLSNDPDEAQLQYNGHILTKALMAGAELGSSTVDPIEVPLVASDAGLDELRLGLVDCPDIQTGFLSLGSHSLGSMDSPTADAVARMRRDQLAHIGRLCSAFVIVTKLSSLGDEGLLQVLTTLRDSMPGVPRILAVNKIKARYSPEDVFNDSRPLLDRFGIRNAFAAYDYRSSLANSRIPAAPSGMKLEAAEPLPIFFEIGTNSGDKQVVRTEKTGDGKSAYLFQLSTQLDPGSLAVESHRSLMIQLQAGGSQAVEWVQKNATLRKQQLEEAWQAVASACYEFMAERDVTGRTVSLRLQASPAVVSQLADSFHRTAPMWMRLSMKIDRTARQFQQAVANSASRFKILQSASSSVTQFMRSFRSGEGAQVVTPKKLAEAIRSNDFGNATAGIADEQLVNCCDVAMRRFADEDKTVLDPKELDAWTKQIWEQMPLSQKLLRGAQPLAVLLGPLLATVLLPLDGGGTAVLVFASTKELLAAAGIAVILGPLAMGGEALKIVHRETPWRQLSDLFATVCDSLGMQRPSVERLPSCSCDGLQRKLFASSLPVKTATVDSRLQPLTMSDDFIRGLRNAIQQCHS